MADLQLIGVVGEVHEFELIEAQKRHIKIDMSDDRSVRVFTANGEEIGGFDFYHYGDDVPGVSPYYELAWAYLNKIDDSYLHKGIGRKILELHSELYGEEIRAGNDDGIRQSDGSHLTGDAPAFIAQMRDEGLIAK